MFLLACIPVAKFTSIYYILAIAACDDWDIEIFDCNGVSSPLRPVSFLFLPSLLYIISVYSTLLTRLFSIFRTMAFALQLANFTYSIPNTPHSPNPQSWCVIGGDAFNTSSPCGMAGPK